MGVIRELPLAEQRALLARSFIGRIACCDHGQQHEGRPYVVPIAYGYDGTAIYAHSGPGRKLAMMRLEPRVTFEVDEARAPDWWQSVICEADFEELTDPAERAHALGTLYPPPGGPPELGADTVVFRLRILRQSGRYERPD